MMQPHAGERAATESERRVRRQPLVAEQPDGVETEVVPVDRHGRRRREAHNGHSDPERLPLVQHLHEVLAARQSGQVAQEHEEQALAAQLVQPHRPPGGVAQREPGQHVPGLDRHAVVRDSRDCRARSASVAIKARTTIDPSAITNCADRGRPSASPRATNAMVPGTIPSAVATT